MAALPPHLSPFSSHRRLLQPPSATTIFGLSTTTASSPLLFQTKQSRFKCSAGQTGFFTKLGRLIKEKAKSDVEKIFSGFTKTRDNLAVIDELLLYWNLSDTDRVLDELEEVFFLCRITWKFCKFPVINPWQWKFYLLLSREMHHECIIFGI